MRGPRNETSLEVQDPKSDTPRRVRGRRSDARRRDPRRDTWVRDPRSENRRRVRERRSDARLWGHERLEVRQGPRGIEALEPSTSTGSLGGNERSSTAPPTRPVTYLGAQDPDGTRTLSVTSRWNKPSFVKLDITF
ncbi:hypothetical protein NDU88_000484 [Pleurodeles waltl]|uniref:Uncharacterized protein n=1 Tax=Pleurodeles waltl TaxID=8319 RepID=A0AAV7MH03_PLEWA|nr:hypothetical protein NDU88_000484 [Pleurodeles waltl]